MSWALLFRARQYLKGSLWVYPLVGAVLGVLLAQVTRQLDGRVSVPDSWQYAPSTASTVLTTIVGAAVGLTGFVVTVTVLAIQMATGTFSARYMRVWYRDHLLKSVLTLLAGTLTLSFSLLTQVGSQSAPNIGVSVAGTLLVLGLVSFLLFFDRFIHRLRPVAVAALAARVATRTILAVTEVAETDAAVSRAIRGEPLLVLVARRGGCIQAINFHGLLRDSGKRDHLIVMQAAIGDFVTRGQPILAVYGNGAERPTTSRRLRTMVALGDERTVEQDPAFAIRIMVDIAVKALSAAINDPTTAVQTLDHLGDVLRLLGSTPLRGTLTFSDSEGRPRLIVPGRTWEDFLTLAVTEIREYGASSLQVVRRLRALLTDLSATIRPEYCDSVAAEMARLDASASGSFAGSVDEHLARSGDRQGIGGPAEASTISAQS